MGERNIGAFAGWSSANDWAIRNGIMHCCTGNAVRSIYCAWEHTLDFDGTRLHLKLLLNHASRWADVSSYIPYEGRVDLEIKQACESVMIRVPDWVEAGSREVSCTVNDDGRDLLWEGRYVHAGSVMAGDSVVLTFPIAEMTVREFIGDGLYTLVVKGNEVVLIDPPGMHCPLYQRAHYRRATPRWRKMRRYVP